MEYKYDASFVPVNVIRDNYDEVAADFLKHYGYEHAIATPTPVPIFEIACKRMGLDVNTTQQLSRNRDILGTIAFEEGDHWFLHRYYFDNLRKKIADSDIAFRCPSRGIKDNDDSTKDEERMEKQARGIAPRILMPKQAARIKIQELMDTHAYSTNDPARVAVLTDVVDELAAFFHVSKVSAKYRMVDLGFMNREDSLGIYNFDTNGAFEWDLSDRPLTVKTSDRPLTRHITLEHAFYEFSKNPAFREMLQSGHFRFVENAFVIDNPKYLRQDDNGEFKLTKYAIEHQQECTLLFEYSVNLSYGGTGKPSANVFGFLTRVETEYKKLPRYSSNVQNGAVFDAAKALDAVKEDFDKFVQERTSLAPATEFWDRVEQIMTAKDIKTNTFKDRSGLDDATVSRVKLKKTAVTMRVAIAACFGLNIDVKEARKLLALAKLALNEEAECLAYEYVIINFKDCPLFEKNDVLKKFGVEPIGVRSSE